MNSQSKIFIINALLGVLTLSAIVVAVTRITHFHRSGEAGATVWFYDQGAKKLYAAPRGRVPPDGANDTRVRATVIGFQGMGNAVSQLKIAYLEKFSPEFKELLERAAKAHAARLPFTGKLPAPGSRYVQENTFVKRPGEGEWHTLASVEAREILNDWHDWRGPAGQAPIISVPLL